MSPTEQPDRQPGEQPSEQPSEQPTLTDGELVLRPWANADSEPARRKHDDTVAHWFGFLSTPPSPQQHLAWVETTHDEWANDRSKVTFLVELDGEPVGSVDVRRREPGVGVLSWVTYTPHR
ncbi:MAG: GNAT family N-acetyltransferase [Terracoccus sp.]